MKKFKLSNRVRVEHSEVYEFDVEDVSLPVDQKITVTMKFLFGDFVGLSVYPEQDDDILLGLGESVMSTITELEKDIRRRLDNA